MLPEKSPTIELREETHEDILHKWGGQLPGQKLGMCRDERKTYYQKLKGEPKGKALEDGQDLEVYSSFTLTPCYSCLISNIKC